MLLRVKLSMRPPSDISWTNQSNTLYPAKLIDRAQLATSLRTKHWQHPKVPKFKFLPVHIFIQFENCNQKVIVL